MEDTDRKRQETRGDRRARVKIAKEAGWEGSAGKRKNDVDATEVEKLKVSNAGKALTSAYTSSQAANNSLPVVSSRGGSVTLTLRLLVCL